MKNSKRAGSGADREHREQDTDDGAVDPAAPESESEDLVEDPDLDGDADLDGDEDPDEDPDLDEDADLGNDGPGMVWLVDPHPADGGQAWTDAPESRVRRSAPAFLVGALVGAVVLGLAWLTTATLDNDSADDTRRSAAQGNAARIASGSPVDATEQQDVVRRTRLDRCGTAEDRLDATLRAARPAMAQWEVHVGAMNQLVLGAITLQQATDFWNQTRLAAKRKLGRFDDALGSVRRSGLNCPVVDRLGHASADLRSCALRVDADERAVGAAQTALETWATHVEDMDMLQMGHLSPADATQAWLASWEQGVQQIQTYQGAARSARHAGAC